KDMKELGELMRDRKLMLNLRENVWNQRQLFMFDYHLDNLVDFFRKVIEKHKNKGNNQEHVKPLFPAIHEKAVADKTYYFQPKPL
ncbi:MAG TPA: glycosyltransferase family 2 protein, partial [Segetibacter sp.]